MKRRGAVVVGITWSTEHSIYRCTSKGDQKPPWVSFPHQNNTQRAGSMVEKCLSELSVDLPTEQGPFPQILAGFVMPTLHKSMLLCPPSGEPGAAAWIRTGSRISGGLGSFEGTNSGTTQAHATTEEDNGVLARHMGMKFMLTKTGKTRIMV